MPLRALLSRYSSIEIVQGWFLLYESNLRARDRIHTTPTPRKREGSIARRRAAATSGCASSSRPAARADIARRRRRGHVHSWQRGRAGGCATGGRREARHTWREGAMRTGGRAAWGAHAVAAPPRAGAHRCGRRRSAGGLWDCPRQRQRIHARSLVHPRATRPPQAQLCQEVLALQRGCKLKVCRD